MSYDISHTHTNKHAKITLTHTHTIFIIQWKETIIKGEVEKSNEHLLTTLE